MKASSIRRVAIAALAASAALVPVHARAAESYDNCAGTISSLPATISTQGVWCMKADLATAITSGAAITIAANNVTIDCNEFKLGGLSAGPGTQAVGIRATNRLNAVIRGCNIRGFLYGIYLEQGSGHIVEDNRIVGSTQLGIVSTSSSTSIRRNAVTDTGGSTTIDGYASGLFLTSGAEAIDNLIDSVDGTELGGVGRGITVVASPGSILARNRISGLVSAGGVVAAAILAEASPNMLIEGNYLVNTADSTAAGVVCSHASSTSLRNAMTGFSIGVMGCRSSGDDINTD